MTTFSPETEARLVTLGKERDAKILEIVETWTRLRRKQGKPVKRKILNDQLNERFQISDGLDALDGWSIEQVISGLKKQLNKYGG